MFAVNTPNHRKKAIKQYTRRSFQSLAPTVVASDITSDKNFAEDLKLKRKNYSCVPHLVVRIRYGNISFHSVVCNYNWL